MNSRLFSTVLLCCTIAACSTSELDSRLNNIEARIAALEDKVSRINDQATVLDVIYSGMHFIKSVDADGDAGYDIVFTDGQTLHVTFGENLPGVSPGIAVQDSAWVYTVDGGETFIPIEGAAKPGAVDGITPVMSIDKYGFWCYSLDKGQTWTTIIDSEGNPISAIDGKGISGTYNFFKNIERDGEVLVFTFHEPEGAQATIPLKPETTLELRYYSTSCYAYAGQDNVFPVIKMEGIKEIAVLSRPKGWEVSLDSQNLTVNTPESGETGVYDVCLLATTESGMAVPYTFSFSYDPDVILCDYFDAGELDLRYWTRYVGSSWGSWDKYCKGDEEHTYVDGGYLTVLLTYEGAHEDPLDNFRTGAVTTDKKRSYSPPYRIDCSARFTEMCTGVMFAVWTRPEKGYEYGEIDIMEKSGFGTEASHTVHNRYTLNTDASKYDQPNAGKSGILKSGDFNVYSVEVRQDAVEIFINGTSVFTYKNIEHSETDPIYSKLTDLEKANYFYNYDFINNDDYAMLIDIALSDVFDKQAIDIPAVTETPAQMDIDWITIRKI